MKTLVNVARYHLVDGYAYTIMPWGCLAFSFVVNGVIAATAPTTPGQKVYTGGVGTIYILVLVLGVLSTTRSLPFGLSLGVSRRCYFFGTVSLAVAMAAVYGLALAVLQIIERSTGGWGTHLQFFRVPYVLPGPWYLTWLTSFVGLTLVFIYGSWYGLVHRRWNIPGLLVFAAAQAVLLLAGILTATWTDAWTSIGHFFTTLSTSGLTGLLAALTAALLVGGYATMRRVSI